MSQPDRTDIDRVQRLIGQRYKLSWIIGRGGMSTVWLAWDSHDEHDVAIKVLKPEYTDSPEFRSRFRNEAETSEKFRSDNVVETYDYAEVEDPDSGTTFCFMVMEYVQGESLSDVLSRERMLPARLALDVMAQVALGLSTIHQHHLIHRDIKPGNLLITPDGLVKVTDFGIAKAAAAVPLTQTGMVVGTAQYVSPEQAQGSQVEASSDIYSLGVVAYEMLSGSRPFIGESTVSVAIKHISDAPPPLPPEIPAHIRELVGICLRKDPRSRYADGAELAAAIQCVADGQRPPQPHSVPPLDVDSQPFTEQLGQVATGSGTAVPPRQGPVRPATGAGAAGARAGSRPAGAGTQAARRENSNSAGPLIALGAVALAALGVVAYLLLSNSDQPAPNPETLTVTNEVTSETTPTLDPETQNTYEPPSSTTSTTTETNTEPESSSSSSTSAPDDSGNSGNSESTPSTNGNGNGTTESNGNGNENGANDSALEDLINGLSGTETTVGEGTAHRESTVESTQVPQV